MNTPLTYGIQCCPYCFLTVAEFLNGRQYVLSPDHMDFVHDYCLAPLLQTEWKVICIGKDDAAC
ncbi:hypothetical protein [Ammoniphilus sp. YIM 78166]|uniref:hypothetical protein n=1 Tax=Ammoniphilus sp. YIM 78166 TaxID=1644106 RepID=UPI00106F62D1|nr:hypothetical protein [Ammoniphilus sp. YIM 78166]